MFLMGHIVLLLCFLACPLVSRSQPTFQPALPSKLFRIQPAHGPVSINGILSEWQGADSVSFALSQRIRDTTRFVNNQVTVKALWDAQKLYLAYRVKDTQLNAAGIESHSSLWQDDCIEFFISVKPGSVQNDVLTTHEYQFLVNLYGTVKTIRGGGHAVAGRNFNWYSDVFAGTKVEGSVNQNHDNDQGYTVELAIYWASLGYHPQPSDTLKVDFCNEDRDDKGSFCFLDWANLPIFFAQPVAWGTAVLCGKAGTDPSPLTNVALVAPSSTARTPVTYWLVGMLGVLVAGELGVFLLKKYYAKGREPAPISPAPANLPEAIFLPASLPLTETPLPEGRQIAGDPIPYGQDLIAKALAILQQEYKSDLRTAEIADRLCLSERHFQRLLKQYTAQSFRELLNTIRLEKARTLLEQTELPIYQIALEVGYENYSYFVRLFKSHFHTSPLAYRKTVQ